MSNTFYLPQEEEYKFLVYSVVNQDACARNTSLARSYEGSKGSAIDGTP